MTTIDAKLRLQAQFGEVSKALAGLRNEIRAVTGEAGNSPQRVPFKGIKDGVASVSVQLAEARRQLLAFIGIQAGLQGVSNLAQMADGYASMAARLRIVTSSQAEYNQALAITRNLATQYQAPLDSTVKLYTRLMSALRPLGGGLNEAKVATEAMLAALKITGATTEESASAILQYSQALGSGILRGEEFNAINEAAPRLLDALAKGLGKPKDELKSLAEQGKLTTSAVVGALQRELPQLQAEAARMPATIGGAVQQVRDSFAKLWGATAEGSDGVRMLIGLFKALADNMPAVISGLTAMVGLIGALKLGAFAQGLATAGMAAAKGATGISAFMLALRGGLGFITGPVGWIVALASLAAGWLALRAAQSKDQTTESLSAERDKVQARVDELRSRLATARVGKAQLSLMLQENEARLAKLDADKQRLLSAPSAPSGEPSLNAAAALRDPTTIRDFETDNKTRERIVKEFTDKRSAYIQAKDKDIAAARLAGDRALEARLLDEKKGSLKEQAKAEQDALKKYAADETQTRLATYKEIYDRVAELAADATARALKLNQSLLDQQLIATKDYFTTRGELEDQESAQSIARLERELQDKLKVLAANQALLKKATTVNEKSAAAEAVTANQSEVDRAIADIERARRDQDERRRQRTLDEAAATREMKRQREEVDYQTKALNDQVTYADLRLSLERQYADARRREKAETGSTVQTDALIEAQLRVAELQRLQAQYQNLLATVQNGERELDLLVAQGAISTEEAERRKFDARERSLPQLRTLLATLRALAKTEPEKTAIERLSLEVTELENRTTEFGNAMRTSIGTGISGMLRDTVTGAQTASQALRGFLGGVAKAALDFITQQIGKKLAMSLLPGGVDAALSGFGNFVAGLFHSGGVVGSGGARVTAPVLAFAAAPRYHSGGIAGLRPNEVPAVLEAGEEVLRADDPRHVKNFRRMVGNISISTTVTQGGGDGGGADATAAGDRLGEMMVATIERWANTESREGGRLARGRA